MTILTKVKAKLTAPKPKPRPAPKRPTFKPEPEMTPDDTLPSETEAQNLEPEPVYTSKKGKKEKPEMPERFKTGGATAAEIEAWKKENWGD